MTVNEKFWSLQVILLGLADKSRRPLTWMCLTWREVSECNKWREKNLILILNGVRSQCQCSNNYTPHTTCLKTHAVRNRYSESSIQYVQWAGVSCQDTDNRLQNKFKPCGHYPSPWSFLYVIHIFGNRRGQTDITNLSVTVVPTARHVCKRKGNNFVNSVSRTKKDPKINVYCD
jgi:hypothetical protein